MFVDLSSHEGCAEDLANARHRRDGRRPSRCDASPMELAQLRQEHASQKGLAATLRQQAAKDEEEAAKLQEHAARLREQAATATEQASMASEDCSRIIKKLSNCCQYDVVEEPANLMTISRELRDAIFKYSLVPEFDFEIRSNMYNRTPKYFVNQSYKLLSLTSKQVRAEAEQGFFEQNNFTLNILVRLPDVPARHVLLMKHIRLWSEINVRSQGKTKCFVEIKIVGGQISTTVGFGRHRRVVTNGTVLELGRVVGEVEREKANAILGATEPVIEMFRQSGITKGALDRAVRELTAKWELHEKQPW